MCGSSYTDADMEDRIDSEEEDCEEDTDDPRIFEHIIGQ